MKSIFSSILVVAVYSGAYSQFQSLESLINRDTSVFTKERGMFVVDKGLMLYDSVFVKSYNWANTIQYQLSSINGTIIAIQQVVDSRTGSYYLDLWKRQSWHYEEDHIEDGIPAYKREYDGFAVVVTIVRSPYNGTYIYSISKDLR